MTVGAPTIEQVELRSHRASDRSMWTVVRVESSAGLIGIGECSDSGSTAVLTAAVTAARKALVGRPVDVDRGELRAWLHARRESTDRSSAFAWSTALGGLESALDDLCARHAGVPLSAYLGHVGSECVQLYANLNRVHGDLGPDALAKAARIAATEGFPGVKIAPFDTVPDGNQMVPAGLATVDTVRAALPPDTALMIDCHFRLGDRDLLTALSELAARDVFWVEDVVDPRDLNRLLRVRERTSLRLAAGEHEWDPAVVEAACDTGALDFWLIDPKHAGGPRATQRLIELTGTTAVSYHNPSGPVGTAHAAHLSGLSPRLTWLEYAWDGPARAEYLSPAEKIEGGALVVASGPGIGVDLAADCGEAVGLR